MVVWGQLHLHVRVIGPWSPTSGSDGEEANSLLPRASFKPAEPQSWASCLSGRARLHGRCPLRGQGAEGATPSRAGRGGSQGRLWLSGRFLRVLPLGREAGLAASGSGLLGLCGAGPGLRDPSPLKVPSLISEVGASSLPCSSQPPPSHISSTLPSEF